MGVARRAHLILPGAPSALGTYTKPKRIQYARAWPNFWSACRSAANFLVRAVATLCRLEGGKCINFSKANMPDMELNA